MQPSVNRLAQDRAVQQNDDTVYEEIVMRLRLQQRQRSEFAGLHVAPPSSGDVPDERETRLVLLHPDVTHSARLTDSPAREAAAKMLETRGSSPRRYRNALLFLAADATRLKDLDQAVRQYLAWKSIEDERLTLNLDAFQAGQAQTKRKQSEEAIEQRIPETYAWLLVPEQEPTGQPSWQEIRLTGQGGLAERVWRKARNEDLVIPELGATILRMWLDKIPLWRGDHVGVKQLAEDFAQYLYLPRLRDGEVLRRAIEDGLPRFSWEQDTFAYAEGHDATSKRYRGLVAGENARVLLDSEATHRNNRRQRACSSTPRSQW